MLVHEAREEEGAVPDESQDVPDLEAESHGRSPYLSKRTYSSPSSRPLVPFQNSQRTQAGSCLPDERRKKENTPAPDMDPSEHPSPNR